MATTGSDPILPRPDYSKEYWFEEMWLKGGRGVFIEIVRHFIFFWMLVGSIFLFSYALKGSSLSKEQQDALDDIHFGFYLVALSIFFITFIIKIIRLESKGLSNE